MRQTVSIKSADGFSLMELTISILILLPVMGAAISLFSAGANQHASEQSSIDANQEARTALEMMTTEIGQAGSHGDVYTTLTSGVMNSTSEQPAPVASAAGFTVGDFVTVDTGADQETVEVTAVAANSFSAVFRVAHDAGDPVRLFALPYTTGMLSPSGLAANASSTVTTLRFFGDISSNSTLQYVEYNYDSANNQITRSVTPIAQSTKNPAIPFVRNLRPNSVQFTLNTDSRGVVTSARVAMTVQNSVKSGRGTYAKLQETTLSSRISIPSAIAGSALLYELQRYGGVDRLPDTPPQVTEWANYEDQ